MSKNIGIESVLQAIFQNSQQEDQQLFQACLDDNTQVAELIDLVKKGDYESVYYQFFYPLKKAGSGLLQIALPNNHKAHFIIEHQDYVDSHYEKLIVRREGVACSADKARTILSGLLRFFISERQIKFNYDGEYTYHLPKTIFTTHDEIIEFFEGIYGLYYGSPEKYLHCLAKILNEENNEIKD